jgi:hypothetical protein
MGNVDAPRPDPLHDGSERARQETARFDRDPAQPSEVSVIETIVSPFHCLYQDALDFHKQSHLRLSRSEAEASRLARAALVLYLASAESLIHQAAVELAPPDLAAIVADPSRPLAPGDAWRLLPTVLDQPGQGTLDPDLPPWPQLEEMLALRATWAYPGPATTRRAYYQQSRTEGAYEPLQPHQVPPGLNLTPERLVFPRTGLPRDPYALRPHHIDTARGILDAAIEGLDRRLAGALTRDGRHRREPVQVVYPLMDAASSSKPVRASAAVSG